MTDIEAIQANVKRVRERIRAAVERSPHGPRDVTLVAVTKMVGVDAVEALTRAGVFDIGENRASELGNKQTALGGGPGSPGGGGSGRQAGEAIRWHFIGRLQTNKVKLVAGRVALIHSVDSEHLLAAIDVRAGRLGIVQDALVEVNLSRDAAKTGLDETAAESLIRGAEAYPNVRIRGVMTMAPFIEAEATRPLFKATRKLFDRLREADYPYAEVDTLSMGMTNDFEVAIEEGATCVRIGRALFRERDRG
jgi:PLP dependent protein